MRVKKIGSCVSEKKKNMILWSIKKSILLSFFFYCDLIWSNKVNRGPYINPRMNGERLCNDKFKFFHWILNHIWNKPLLLLLLVLLFPFFLFRCSFFWMLHKLSFRYLHRWTFFSFVCMRTGAMSVYMSVSIIKHTYIIDNKKSPTFSICMQKSWRKQRKKQTTSMPERGEKEKNGIMNKYLTKSRTILFTFAYAYTANKIASNNDSHIQIHARDSHRGTRKIKKQQ